MGKILIIPDVHSRLFWKEPLKHVDEYEHIVFLGDYLDSYPDEDTNDDTGFANLEEIISLKRENPRKITLLFGNHDLGYIDNNICRARHDWENSGRNNKIFRENFDLFDIAWETKIGETRYFLSHSGVKKRWLETNKMVCFNLKDFSKLPSQDYFNNFLHSKNMDQLKSFFYALACVSGYRGGWDGIGSMVWSDVRENFKVDNTPVREYEDVYQIFAHTRLQGDPIVTDGFACLDSSRGFTLDTDSGKICELDGTPVKETEIHIKTKEELEKERKELEKAMAFFC